MRKSFISYSICQGHQRKIVEGHQFLKTTDAYSEAKKTLEKRFGHPSVVAEAFRKKLENWPKIHPKDGFAKGICRLLEDL